MSFGSIEDKRLVKTTPSNGIYYFQLISDEVVITRKATLLK